MVEFEEYNPLDYRNLTRNLVQELMNRPPHSLPLPHRFNGAGVYALFYAGDFAAYRYLVTPNADQPIYVGKAVPGGARKGRTKSNPSTSPLYNRINEHARSIRAVENLRIEDFLCRYLVVTPLWITMAERFLIEHYQPLWNLAVDGFGDHDLGSGRHQGEISWWDALHPGRNWAAKLRQTRSQAMAEEHVRRFVELQMTRPEEVARIVEERLEEEELSQPS
jgi:hypothetical protein